LSLAVRDRVLPSDGYQSGISGLANLIIITWVKWQDLTY
jgi:hypothetical protein